MVAALAVWRHRGARAAVVGLWAGYGAFCLAFAYHVATHDYYHLPLVPIVALSLGPPVAVLARRVVRTNRPWPWRAAAAALGLALVAGAAARGVARAGAGADPAEPRTAAEIGAVVRHTPRAVVLAADYGGALEYHGRLAGWPWPLASDLEWERLAGVPPLGAEERFRRWFAPLAPEYFVVADRRELDGQPDLAAFLAGRYPVVASAERYVVFDLRAGALHRAAGAPGDGGPLAGGSR
jgi:hypothetical protein